MSVICPYCRFEMELKGARPGRFRPKCQQCGRAFAMVVAEDSSQPIKVIRLEEKASGEATVPQVRQRAAQKQEAARTAVQGQHAAAGNAAAQATVPQSAPARKLGGYEIIREIGRGAMGSVYLARQVSLDRPVAVKVMNPEWSRDPVFLSRFTREAYAAAQLVHHNVVQIYDIGEDQGTNFFSMEFVEGQTLGDMIERKGRLSVEEAVGYTLQAARGLKFAHDRAMIHRDVKPDNLMLNRDGIVKVADLGLVKTPGSMSDDQAAAPSGLATPGGSDTSIRTRTGVNITQVNKAMGTPAFMAPEQVRDAAHVDQRADIYSLGCSLYTMVTGRTVFDGATADEIMTKQATQPIEPPDAVVKGVPHELSDVLMKMLAKDPAQRFQKLDEVIRALEGFLGVEAATGAGPSEANAAALDGVAAAFDGARAAGLRRAAVWGFFIVIALLGAGLLASGRVVAGLAALGVGVLAPPWYVLISGVMMKTYVFRRIRQYVLGSRLADWLKLGGIGVLVIALLVVLNLHVAALVTVIVAGVLAAGFHFSLDRMLEAERRGPLEQAQKLVRSMRLKGMEEDAIREFICRYAGEQWEPLYEAMFGYEAKIEARERWGLDDRGRFRTKHGAWRDRIVRWVEAREHGRKLERDRRFLARVERKALEAKGVNELTARRQARREADQIVQKAEEARSKLPGYVDAPIRRVRLNPFTLLLGARARFVVGAVLIAACVVWMHQNGLIPGKEMKAIGEQMIEDRSLAEAEQAKTTLAESLSLKGKQTRPLDLPGLPASVATWFNSYNPGLAGLVLVVSGIVAGVRMTLFLLPAVAVIMFGHAWGIPAVWKVPQEYMSMAAGGVLALLAFYFGRS